MRFSSVFCIVIIFLSSSVRAEVVLSVVPGITLLAINGSEIDSGSFFENKSTIILPDGKNQILVQYSSEIKKSGNLEIEITDPHVLVFSVNDNDILLSVPDIKRFSEFRKFNAGKLWLLKDSSDHSVEYLSKPLLKEGFQINRDYERELQDLNNAGGDLSINKSMSLSLLSSRINQSNNNSNSINLPEVLLKYWYLNADTETRHRFKSWVSDK